MKKIMVLLAMVSLFFLLSCAGSFKDIKVQAEANPKVDLSKYKTYIWGGSAELVLDKEGRWIDPKMDVNAEIRFLVDQEMRKRGFTRVKENADIRVAAAVGVHMDAITI